jgi:hypothetical protein
MHELRLRVTSTRGLAPQLAALGLVRQLPALATLELLTDSDGGEPVQWPPFVPPSLKTLRIKYDLDQPVISRSLLRALPSMLEASGATLECLELNIPCSFRSLGDGLVHLAQALRVCSPTLKSFRLSAVDADGDDLGKYAGDPDREGYADRVERLRVQWTDLLAGVSTCRELEVLELLPVEVKPVFPPGTAFARLTELKVVDYEPEHPSDGGVMGLWEVMASGGMPALAKLTVRLQGRWGAEEVKTRVVPAFEALAGTFKRLCLDIYPLGEWPGNEGVAYQLGVAVGQLRRLNDLALNMSDNGRTYHALAHGLAASGGDRPLPLLWRVKVFTHVEDNADLLTSLLLPSVRVFISDQMEPSAALVTACAVRQIGYKHSWAVGGDRNIENFVIPITQCSTYRHGGPLHVF